MQRQSEGKKRGEGRFRGSGTDRYLDCYLEYVETWTDKQIDCQTDILYANQMPIA